MAERWAITGCWEFDVGCWMFWSAQSERQRREDGLRVEVVEPPAARLIIMVEAVLEAEGLALADSTFQPDLHSVLLILDSERQATHEVVLVEISQGERVAGGQVGHLVEDVTPAGDRAVDVPGVRRHCRAAVGRRNGPRVLVG